MSERLANYGAGCAQHHPEAVPVYVGLAPAYEIESRVVSNGVVVSKAYRNTGSQIEIPEIHVFVDANTFAEYMRAWFIAHHGDKAVTQLPQARGFAPGGEG